jgi:replicative DNA helicase
MNKADLVTIFSKLHRLCKGHHVYWWATYFDELLSRINSAKNIDEIVLIISENPVRRQIFGGMGSLNDLFICKDNGHIVENEKAANQELEKLRRDLRRLFPGYY